MLQVDFAGKAANVDLINETLREYQEKHPKRSVVNSQCVPIFEHPRGDIDVLIFRGYRILVFYNE
jgi:hypothetical protein